MRPEVPAIVDQMQRALRGPAWPGPALEVLLAGLTAEQAAAKPMPGLHSIWEIVLHLTAWHQVVRLRLEGEARADLTAAEDWPPVTRFGARDWAHAMQALVQHHQHLCETVAALPESRLDQIVPGQDYSCYIMLYGVVQHDLYHAGQIALLRKLVI